jgi:hypothetical protein
VILPSRIKTINLDGIQDEEGGVEVKYPIRCEIIDVTGTEVFKGVMGRTPEVSLLHIGKHGLAEAFGAKIRITLDDGTVLMGHECWWVPEDRGPWIGEVK